MKALLLLAVIVLPATLRATGPIPYRAPALRNACLVHAIGFSDAVNARRHLTRQRWTRVLVIESRRTRHALCAFEVAGVIWLYDPNTGSARVGTDPRFKLDATRLVRAAAKARTAVFLEDSR